MRMAFDSAIERLSIDGSFWYTAGLSDTSARRSQGRHALQTCLRAIRRGAVGM